MNLTARKLWPLLALCAFLAWAPAGISADPFPRAEPASHLLIVEERQLSTPALQLMMATLQGISARSSSTQIFILNNSSATWLKHLTTSYAMTSEPVRNPLELVARYKSLLKGFVRCDLAQSNSISAATSLAGPFMSIAVDKSIESEIQKLGLTNCFMDVSDRDEAWVRKNYATLFHPQVLVEQKESLVLSLRDYAVMANAFTFFDGNSHFRSSLLNAFPQGGSILGWGDASRGEERFIKPASRAGFFTVPADHARNISVLSGIRETNLQQKPSLPLPTHTNAHYVCFVITDGDNLQWNLNAMHRYLAQFRESEVPVGFGLAPSIVDLAPSVLRWYYENARPGKDYFTVGPSGGGYLYPSHFPPGALDVHLRRLNEAMERADLRMVQILDFDSFERRDLWDKYTALSSIDALVYFDYSRYDNIQGRILWSNNKPVISARAMLWDGLPNADEQSLIRHLNAASRNPRDLAAYTLVAVHAWSKRAGDIERVVSSVSRDVHVVTPEIFARFITRNLQP